MTNEGTSKATEGPQRAHEETRELEAQARADIESLLHRLVAQLRGKFTTQKVDECTRTTVDRLEELWVACDGNLTVGRETERAKKEARELNKDRRQHIVDQPMEQQLAVASVSIEKALNRHTCDDAVKAALSEYAQTKRRAAELNVKPSRTENGIRRFLGNRITDRISAGAIEWAERTELPRTRNVTSLTEDTMAREVIADEATEQMEEWMRSDAERQTVRKAGKAAQLNRHYARRRDLIWGGRR